MHFLYDELLKDLFSSVAMFKPITRQQILDSSKLNEFADDNVKFDENGRELTKRAKNTVGQEEIARYEQFLFFPQCFWKACFPGEWVNLTINSLPNDKILGLTKWQNNSD